METHANGANAEVQDASEAHETAAISNHDSSENTPTNTGNQSAKSCTGNPSAKSCTGNPSAKSCEKPVRVAVVTMGVKLGDETRGYTRFRKISEMLSEAGFEVDLITTSFQHWEKKQRDTQKDCYKNLPYNVVFINEPGYSRNIDPRRIHSHSVAAKNLRKFFRSQFSNDATAYDLIYSEIPPNDVARVCAEVADKHDIPYVADINDLWPEAMRMVVDVPVVSDIAFHPFSRDAKVVYRLISAAVGTSDEYALRPMEDRDIACPHITVYVGNDLSKFDEGAKQHEGEVAKPENEFWITYAGTLGASYDIETLIKASVLLNESNGHAAESNGQAAESNGQAAESKGQAASNAPEGCNPSESDINANSTTEGDEGTPRSSAEVFAPEITEKPARPHFRVKILGDGPDRQKFEELAQKLDAPVDFVGYCDYGLMAAYLCESDLTINSLVKSAVQSIVTKIGDYLAAGRPMINTGTSAEFCNKVSADGFGVNVEPENPEALAAAILNLSIRPNRRRIMGARARNVAVEQFDQKHSYRAIVNLVRNLTK